MKKTILISPLFSGIAVLMFFAMIPLALGMEENEIEAKLYIFKYIIYISSFLASIGLITGIISWVKHKDILGFSISIVYLVLIVMGFMLFAMRSGT